MNFRGFTLIEILLVCVLIATLVAMVSPRLGGTSRSLHFEESVQHLAETIRFARHEAVRRRLRVSIQFIEAGTKYRLAIQDRLAWSKEGTAAFEDNYLGSEWVLPKGTHVKELVADQVTRVPSRIVFSPSGAIDPTILIVSERDGIEDYKSFIELGAWYDEVRVMKVMTDNEIRNPSPI